MDYNNRDHVYPGHSNSRRTQVDILGMKRPENLITVSKLFKELFVLT